MKSKGKGKVSIHFSADQDTVDTIYRIVLSVNQLSVYGAVAAICDEYEGHQDSTGQPVILEGQSIVLGEIKAEVPAHDEEPKDAQIVLQQYFQQVKSLSPENRLSKFCKEAGLCVSSKLDNISSQEMLVNLCIQLLVTNTLFLETIQLLNRKDGSKETRELDLFWKSQRAFSTLSTELKFEFPVKEDNSQSWVRISFGTVRYVNNCVL